MQHFSFILSAVIIVETDESTNRVHLGALSAQVAFIALS